jgi:hypothetical protein
MRWVRSRVRLAAWSALLALTLQLALSFGHLHFDHVSPPSLAGLAGQSVILPPATVPDAPTAPAQNKPAHDFCAICSVTGLAGVAAMVPALPVPIEYNRISFDAFVEFAIATSPNRFFQARAPPNA